MSWKISNDQIKYKGKRREQATLSRNYKLCDELTEDMSAIKKRRECEVELQVWKRRQQQASWYTVQGNESHQDLARADLTRNPVLRSILQLLINLQALALPLHSLYRIP